MTGKHSRFLLLGGIGLALAAAACAPTSEGPPKPIPAEMTFAPKVPAPIQRNEPAHVIINLATSEEKRPLSQGVTYEFWSYNGHTPGPFIRMRVGDTFEVHLDNARGSLTHTVDFHAVTGPGGGAAILMADPGGSSRGIFKAIKPGLFIYHCAAPPVPSHIANGLYGLVLVEPLDGLRDVDREYYVMQSEFYTEGEVGEEGFQPFSSQKGLAETPEYVVFNGNTQALMGEGRLEAEVGDTVRLYVGNIGPNLVSSFHVIGEMFDRVYREGGLVKWEPNIQTTLIPSGSASMVEFRVDVPGDYLLVDHSIFRLERGAAGILHVSGDPVPSIYRKGS